MAFGIDYEIGKSGASVLASVTVSPPCMSLVFRAESGPPNSRGDLSRESLYL